MTSRHEPATLISWSVTPYRSPGCADVLRGARADVKDFSYMTLMETSVVKHNMLKVMLMSVASKISLSFQSKFSLYFQQFILVASSSELYDIPSYVYVVNCSGANLMTTWNRDAQNRKQLVTIMVAIMMI